MNRGSSPPPATAASRHRRGSRPQARGLPRFLHAVLLLAWWVFPGPPAAAQPTSDQLNFAYQSLSNTNATFTVRVSGVQNTDANALAGIMVRTSTDAGSKELSLLLGPDRKKVIADLANVQDRDSIVGKITFDDHGQNTVAVITKYVVQDGKFVEWDDSEYKTGKRKLPGQK